MPTRTLQLLDAHTNGDGKVDYDGVREDPVSATLGWASAGVEWGYHDLQEGAVDIELPIATDPSLIPCDQSS